ncbi:MAG: bifunctional tRNA (5-methylaminomethyl-2-thiouridine)(34)-methyltransferase MnmD/FAD-dependent 5-carboxymethylaminomethyl-2-thiouridine(34) oxidoreductase MnmC [Rhodospirillaceae bacterium]|nr:bifunctional tRNA (5-methylaminomethyl-2-thiouridine)(34)-methyltransferase MnmD/FAD-dependent 5-carboxymethylaminomethyl-2-thiouridine(34) oxidoreductase MnmC [Rhodospirillaceae bacterium]
MTNTLPQRPLRDPGLTWRSGRTPFASAFGDVYFSCDGGLDETRHVFLNGCGLPEAWTNRPAFTIGELGFGTGRNFLAAWALWRRAAPQGARLHYIAVEGCPLTRAEVAECLAPLSELQDLARELLRIYPEPQPGFHRLFPAPDVHLTLLYGEAALALGQLEAGVDAWFLDGFSPDKNPAMWSGEVFAEIARLSRPGARLATYSAASGVRRGLDAAGFDVEKSVGFGHKREMLRGRFRGVEKPKPALQPWFAHAAHISPGHAAIVGGGIAGTSVAAALQRRGWRTTIIDRRNALAGEASGNPTGVLMPRMTAAPNLDGRFYAAAWRFGLQTVEELGARGFSMQRGLLQLATDEAEAARHAAIIAAAPLPGALLSRVDAKAASDIAGCNLPFGALHFPHGGWLEPDQFCQALAQESRTALDVDVGGLEHTGGRWRVRDRAGNMCMAADIVILANGFGATTLPQTQWISLQVRRGQITLAPPTPSSAALRSVLTYGGYITPAHNGVHSIGATFDWVNTDTLDQKPSVHEEDHARNLAELARALPHLAPGGDVSTLSGRAGLRCTTLDHLPLAGPVPDYAAYVDDFAELRHGHPWARYAAARYQPGLYALTGLGSRGLTTAPLAAEVIASQIAGEPWPLERDLVTALHPGRFLVRALKRRDA